MSYSGDIVNPELIEVLDAIDEYGIPGGATPR